MKKKKVIKIGAVVLTIALAVGIFFTIREIAAEHKVVSIHKVINKESGEEIVVFDDDELEDILDDALLDLDLDEEDLSDWLEEELPDADEEQIVEDDLVIPDQADSDEYSTNNPITGTPIAENDASRDISISLTDVAYADYMSTGGNSFSELTSDTAVIKGFDSVDWEIQKYFWYKLNGAYSRVLFCMDGMITDSYEGQDPVVAGIVSSQYENQDYLNYTGQGGDSGDQYIYSFDNDQMDSLFRMIEAHYENGTEVWLNTGWKVASRIQSWYSASSAYPEAAAPYDVKAFVIANIALLLECEDRYPGTVKYIAFGNEAANENDFANDGDNIRYTRVLYTLMKVALEHYDELKGIKLCAGEDAEVAYDTRDQSYVQLGGELRKEGIIDGYSVHYYYRTSNGWFPYDYWFNRICFANQASNGGVFINETLWAPYDMIDDYSKESTYDGEWWTKTAPSFQVLAANSGAKGGNKWSYGAMYWPHLGTLGEPGKSGAVIGNSLFGTGATLPTSTQYYVVAMMQNYITAHSDVMKVNWEGEDLRVTAFRLEDGNYTFLVEANESALQERKLNFKLGSSLGKKLYRISYSESEEQLTDGLVPVSDEDWTNDDVGATFTDTIGSKYCTYIYTTKEPIGQVMAEEQEIEVKTDATASLELKGVECDIEDVEWEILASAGTAGVQTYTQRKYTDDKVEKSNTAKAVYTPSTAAVSGDRIVVKATATLSDGTSTYTVFVITIE